MPDGYEHHFASACMTDIQRERSSSRQCGQPHAVHDFIRRNVKPNTK